MNFKTISEFFDRYADPKTTTWFLMSSPWPTVAVVFIYLIFVKVLGPLYMNKRQAFNLKGVLIVYNAFNVLFNLWIWTEIASAIIDSSYSWICQPADYSLSPKAQRIASVLWYYYFSKLIDLLDTVLFILRKRYSHVSFLHVVHHFEMPICAWISVKLLPTGPLAIPAMINSFVHTVMYSYYLLSAMGPEIRKYLWWKKYITTLQITSFVVIFSHFVLPFIWKRCEAAYHPVAWVGLSTSAMFLILFINFYKNTYSKNVVAKNRKITK